jgi:tRNA 5-methylaminomethyl-2-thiouridine biosynthesis bifunctional protein
MELPKQPILIWDENGYPHSTIFDDKYYCKEDGYQETMYVACGGNHLQERFSQLDPKVNGIFNIVETGFGTGLNFCCALKLWQDVAPQSWQLHFHSLEKYPLTPEQMRKALSIWPQLAQQAEALIAVYQPSLNDLVVREVIANRVKLIIAFEDVLLALARFKQLGVLVNGVDAIFLDGFAPAKNPLMWTLEVYKALAALSASATTLATFTVAGHVRRGLTEAGFNVCKIKGFGTKKHVLVGRYASK